MGGSAPWYLSLPWGRSATRDISANAAAQSSATPGTPQIGSPLPLAAVLALALVALRRCR